LSGVRTCTVAEKARHAERTATSACSRARLPIARDERVCALDRLGLPEQEHDLCALVRRKRDGTLDGAAVVQEPPGLSPQGLVPHRRRITRIAVTADELHAVGGVAGNLPIAGEKRRPAGEVGIEPAMGHEGLCVLVEPCDHTLLSLTT